PVQTSAERTMPAMRWGSIPRRVAGCAVRRSRGRTADPRRRRPIAGAYRHVMGELPSPQRRLVPTGPSGPLVGGGREEPVAVCLPDRAELRLEVTEIARVVTPGRQRV